MDLQNQITDALKIEQRMLLTSGQLKNTIDNLDIAVVAQRIYNPDTCKTFLFYHNSRCINMFGYSESDYQMLSTEDQYFFIDYNSRQNYLKKVKQLMCKVISLEGFVLNVNGTKKDGTRICIEIKALSFQEFSYGHELFISCRDITSDIESRKIQDNLLDAMPGGAIIYKFGKTIETLYFSDGIIENNGYTKEEYEKKIKDDPINATVYESDREKLRDKVLSAVAENKPFSSSFRIRTKNGTILWMQISADMIRQEPDGKIYYAICTRPSANIDIYKNILDYSDIPVIITERKTHFIIFANHSWKRLYNLVESLNVSGKKLEDIIYPNNSFFMDMDVDNLAKDNFAESHFMTSYGRYIHVRVRRIDLNGYDSLICYFSDETLQWENHMQLQKVINNIPNGVAVYEIDSNSIRRTFINETYKKQFGEFLCGVGEYDFRFIHPMDQINAFKVISDIRYGKDKFDIQFRILDQSENYRWIRSLGSVTERVDGVATLYCSYSDFNVYMETQRDLKSNYVMLKQAMSIAKTMTWKYDFRTHIITDSLSMGEVFGLNKIVENVPERFIHSGKVSPDCIDTLMELYDDTSLIEIQRDICIIEDEESISWYRVILTPVFDSLGNYVETIGSAVDITREKKSESNYK